MKKLFVYLVVGTFFFGVFTSCKKSSSKAGKSETTGWNYNDTKNGGFEKTQYAGNDSELMWRIRHNPNDALDIVKNEVKPETINNRNNYSETALEILVRQENTEAAKLLIDKGANVDLLYLRDDVNGNDKNGFYTISHIAALDKNSELLDYLETAGADQSMKDSEGNTAKDILEATIYHNLEKKPSNDMEYDLFS